MEQPNLQSFHKEEIELINEVCGEWAEFVFQQDLDVLLSILECIKEQRNRGIEIWNSDGAVYPELP